MKSGFFSGGERRGEAGGVKLLVSAKQSFYLIVFSKYSVKSK